MAYRIMGTGSALPERVVTNDELSTFLDTDDAWISTRTGIRSRHVVTHEKIADLAEAAARAALQDAGVGPEELDLIVGTTVSADDLSPSLAAVVQERLGATCPAFDVNGACAGFVFALDVADGYFARGRARRVLIVSAEEMSRTCDWADRSTCVLFGDAAAAAVLGDGGSSPLFTHLTTKGDREILHVPGIEGNSPFKHDRAQHQGLIMRGREVFKFAVTSIVADVQRMCAEAGIGLNDVDHYVFHQANGRILDAAVERAGIDAGRVARTIADTGNVSSACIPLALDRLNRAGELHEGDLVCLSGFGAGLVVATTLIRWGSA